MNAKVAEAVIERAQGRCECGCGMHFNDTLTGRMELDHVWGRAKAIEAPDTVWALRAECHRSKTDSYPSAAYWLARFGVHAKRHGLSEALDRALETLSWKTASNKTG